MEREQPPKTPKLLEQLRRETKDFIHRKHIDNLIITYGLDAVKSAVEVALGNNKKSYAYIKALLDQYK